MNACHMKLRRMGDFWLLRSNIASSSYAWSLTSLFACVWESDFDRVVITKGAFVALCNQIGHIRSCVMLPKTIVFATCPKCYNRIKDEVLELCNRFVGSFE